MPLVEIRIQNYRAFKDSGIIRISSPLAIVGRNDVGKSAILHALQTFFKPPKKGFDENELHNGRDTEEAMIEVALLPSALTTCEIQIDAKNKVHIVDDSMVDSKGLLRLRLRMNVKGVSGFEMKVNDVEFEDYHALCMKKHDALLALLEKAGLEAKAAGKETNQEKRSRLRAHATSSGAKKVEKWVDSTEIEGKLRQALPEFVFFTDSPRYDVEETPVQNQFRSIVDKALEGHKQAGELVQSIQTTVQGEFDKVFARLNLLTDAVVAVRADTNVSWKKAVDGVTLNWLDSAGVETPYGLRGAGIRRLFMVAYFQYFAAESMHDEKGKRYIFAIEEPEVHLHPGAQRQLVEAFDALAYSGHLVLFTTHSPVFASTAKFDDLVLITRTGNAANSAQSPTVRPVAVARELGVEASDRLVGKNYVVLVEGKRDVDFYTFLLRKLFDLRAVSLNPSYVMFLQAGGVNNLSFMVTAACLDETGLKWAAISDSDRLAPGSPPSKEVQEIKNSLPASCLFFKVLERSAIENYLDATIVKKVIGVDCVIPTCGKPMQINGKKLHDREWSELKARSAEIAEQMGIETFRRMPVIAGGRNEFVALFEDLKAAFAL
jgi:predicted ATP-dependent endonuclease of OLD family